MAAPDNRTERQAPFTPVPRVLVPASVAKGESFAVKTLIAHPMETGLREDGAGNIIPRHIINKFVCRLSGALMVEAELHEAMAANPFFEFHLRADESGTLQFEWHEDGGAVFRLEHDLTVT